MVVLADSRRLSRVVVAPSYQGRVNEEELFELIAYLRTLGAAAPESGTRPEERR